ncbi:tRNA (adenosine(37)-N6)-dimethylallyltransferase MiaA [Nocardioides sp. zg-536]|uniref:tRNA dimethylallyltransferase n=1 Tax=Nocardioides faecalis TaxID=2803858 RepID=A0A939BWU5_9ACTN|nr:tRNA (adenosine(37)-N6)-dimethylallyltransferase MiaA [Nocardioides faecalis]MBM9461426.1 tRNA (adenosine(37)-N6)-dimethylallyltransferase MiaA [Nocardioides faecalis]QVI59384.1 tRNA (adenosine(37)-N6)-dimethylallyltransferase MiaA [Nocardioides faecalis]
MASDATTASAPVPIVAIVGPTASGKTALSLDLAEALGGEVVNTDAMQVYRGMDIGTAKLPLAERRGIPHHLLDTLEVSEPATVAEFQGWARAAIAELRARGATPVLVGGSALYTRAILDRFDFPGTDPAVRERLEAELAEVGSAVLHARLRELDPVAAERIEVENGRRVVRALEVIEITGTPFSARLPEAEYVDPHTVQLGVAIDKELLHERIAIRVRRMFDDGLVEEVERLLSLGLATSRTAGLAIGYRQAMAVLAGEMTREEAIESTIVATRKFARRQMAWWRNDPRITWLDHDDPDLLAKAVDVVRALR